MKTKYLMLSLLFACPSMIIFAQAKTDTIKVCGNCGTCKNKIERAATEAGATSADWNSKTKLLVVSYDASKTSNMDIQKKIASVGYDTQDEKAPDAAYNSLEKCCQYKRGNADTTGVKDMKGMNMSGTNCMAMMSNTKHMDCTTENCCNNECSGNNSCKDAALCTSPNATSDCCKTKFGKGYYYIGSSCAIEKRIGGITISSNNGTKCCKI
jgi:mercuric ion binding protein